MTYVISPILEIFSIELVPWTFFKKFFYKLYLVNVRTDEQRLINESFALPLLNWSNKSWTYSIHKAKNDFQCEHFILQNTQPIWDLTSIFVLLPALSYQWPPFCCLLFRRLFGFVLRCLASILIFNHPNMVIFIPARKGHFEKISSMGKIT